MKLVGVFGEKELRTGKDKAAVAEAMAKTGYKYTHTEITSKGLKIYVCDITEAD